MQSAELLTSQANQTSDTTVRASLASQFDALVTQIGQLATNSGFNGINLLAGNTLTVVLDETGSSSTSVTGVDYTNATTGLGIATSTNAWANASDITSATTNLTAALTTLRSELQTLSANLSTVQIRQDFTKATINTLQTGSADLTLADFEPGRRQLARLADPPAAVDHSSVIGLASRPERPPAVPLNRFDIQRWKTAAFRPPFFFRLARMWLINY